MNSNRGPEKDIWNLSNDNFYDPKGPLHLPGIKRSCKKFPFFSNFNPHVVTFSWVSGFHLEFFYIEFLRSVERHFVGRKIRKKLTRSHAVPSPNFGLAVYHGWNWVVFGIVLKCNAKSKNGKDTWYKFTFATFYSNCRTSNAILPYSYRTS